MQHSMECAKNVERKNTEQYSQHILGIQKLWQASKTGLIYRQGSK